MEDEERGVGPEGLLERIRAIVPLVAERAGTAEEARRPDDDVIDALCTTGVFRSFVPARYGGYEIDLDLFTTIGTEVAEACASTGWITTFYMEHNWLLTRFPRATQDELYAARPYVLAPGSVNPTGRAVPSTDGYVLNGHWQFGTGVTHADWVLLSGVIEGAESPTPRLFLAPIDDVEVKDTWHVDGMCATGSRDIVARSVTIPADRISLTADAIDSSDDADSYLGRIPLRPMLSLTAAIPALGCARRAVALFRQRCAERVLFGSSTRQSEQASSQIRIAEVTARTVMAEAAMRSVAATMSRVAKGEQSLDAEELQLMRVVLASVVRQCRDVTRDVMEASGAKAHFLDNELQRIHRDIHVVGAHTVFDLDLVAREAGRSMLATEAAT